MMTMQDLLALVTFTPPVEWDDVVTRWLSKDPAVNLGKDYLPPIEQRMDPMTASHNLDRAIILLARFRAYFDARFHSGCTHAEAVKDANKLVTKVRRALGYTYPKDDLNF